MATLKRKDRSPYWHGIYKRANGKLRSRSTKTTKKREARRIVNEWELEEQKIRNGKSDEAREIREFMERYVADQHRKGWSAEDAIKAIVKLQEIGSGKELKIPTLRRHFLDWMVMKKEMVSESTYKLYGQALRSFDRNCGAILDKRLYELETTDLLKLQKDLIDTKEETKIKNKTINHKITILKSVIKDAHVQGHIKRNIGLGVKALPEWDSTLKVPFTSEEIVELCKHADTEWKGMILFGKNTGWRISVIANLRWENINVEDRLIIDQNNKQKRSLKLKDRKPMIAYLMDSTWNYLKFIGFKKEGYIFPELQAQHYDTRTRHFTDKLMVKAGVPKSVPHPYLKDDDGNVIMGERTFHCLRHSANSDMANNDVSMDVRKKSLGHTTDMINEGYTHIDLETIKRNYEKVPDIDWQDVM